MSTSKKRLSKGLNELFGGDLQTVLDDIENNSTKQNATEVNLMKFVRIRISLVVSLMTRNSLNWRLRLLSTGSFSPLS